MIDRVLRPADVRFLAYSMIHAETERDRQEAIGASTLSNPCDNCLAAEFMGQSRFSGFAERPYLGGDLGTLIHSGLDGRQGIAQQMYPGALAERKVTCCHIPGYGDIPGHFDLQPTTMTIVDWKGSLRWKIALLEDYLRSRGIGERIECEPRWAKQKDRKNGPGGYKFESDSNTVVSLSSKQYDEEMASMAFKYLGYYGQQNLYMNATGARTANLVFIARDGTGFFDNPEYPGYDDPARKHDIFVLQFHFDPAYTQALIQRGTDIWTALQTGTPISAFASHPSCHACESAKEDRSDMPTVEFDALDAPPVAMPTVKSPAENNIAA